MNRIQLIPESVNALGGVFFASIGMKSFPSEFVWVVPNMVVAVCNVIWPKRVRKQRHVAAFLLSDDTQDQNSLWICKSGARLMHRK